MTYESLNINLLKDKIGIGWEPERYEIEKGGIRKLVRAIGDSNPLWQDEEYARKSRYGGIIAPPIFPSVLGVEKFPERFRSVASVKNILNSGIELDCYQPIKVGDVITAITKIADISERQGKKTKMLLVTLETIYKNQRQEVVARSRNMALLY